MGSGCLPGGTHPPRSEPKALGWRTKSLVGWWSQPKESMAPHKENTKRKEKEKGKREVGRKRRTPPSQTELEESSSTPSAGTPLGPLCPKASPSPPPIYIGGLGLFETQLCHVQTLAYYT